MKQLLLIASILILCLSCSKKGYTEKNINGVKNISNTATPNNADLNINLKLLYSLDFNTMQDSALLLQNPYTMDFDSEGNYYILEPNTPSVKKFSPDGKLLLNFLKRGTGPGELPGAGELAIISDTIYVHSFYQLSFCRFDKKGQFIDKKYGKAFYQSLKSAGSGFLVMDNNNLGRAEAKEAIFDFKILNANLQTVAELNRTQVPMDKIATFDLMKIIPLYDEKNGQIALAKNSSDDYSITVYNLKGQPQYVLKKSSRQIAYDQIELAEFNKNLQQMSNGNAPLLAAKNKMLISDLFFDDQQRLWVKKSIDKNSTHDSLLYFDIFKDGIYLKTISSPLLTGKDIYDFNEKLFYDHNRIYFLNQNTQKLQVFEISENS